MRQLTRTPLKAGVQAYATAQKRLAAKRPPAQPKPEMVAIQVRLAKYTDAARIAAVNVETWHDAYRGIMPEAVLATVTQDRFEPRWEEILMETPGPLFTLVADDPENGVVGFMRAGPAADGSPRAHEVFAINVLPRFQRRGVGGELLESGFARLARHGARDAFLWVLGPNAKARFFFKTMGGLPAGTGKEKLGRETLPKVAYAWDELVAPPEDEAAAAG